jgi:hypothetical protein
VTHEEVHNKYFAAIADCECAIRNRVLLRLENNDVFEPVPAIYSIQLVLYSQPTRLGQNSGGLDCVTNIGAFTVERNGFLKSGFEVFIAVLMKI